MYFSARYVGNLPGQDVTEMKSWHPAECQTTHTHRQTGCYTYSNCLELSCNSTLCVILGCLREWHVWVSRVESDCNADDVASRGGCRGFTAAKVTLYWGYLIILWLFHLGISCTVFVLTCFVMCGCFGNMCNCIYCVLYCLYCVFCIVLFMYIYSYLFCLF